MDQRERSNDIQTALQAMMTGALANVWTAIPAIVIKFDPIQMSVEVRPSIMVKVKSKPDSSGNQTEVATEIYPLIDVPVVFPSAGGFLITFPIAAGDEVLIVLSTRCISAWWQQGGVQPEFEFRLHDLSDGFAIPGPRSLPRAKVVQPVSTTNMQLRTENGLCRLEMTPAGAINILAPADVSVIGNLTVIGNLAVAGTIVGSSGMGVVGLMAVTGDVVASGEIIAKDTHTVSAHTHTDPQGGTTGLPTL